MSKASIGFYEVLEPRTAKPMAAFTNTPKESPYITVNNYRKGRANPNDPLASGPTRTPQNAGAGHGSWVRRLGPPWPRVAFHVEDPVLKLLLVGGRQVQKLESGAR